ncbi:cellulose binding domain-containing protein [Luedemannella flava]
MTISSGRSRIRSTVIAVTVSALAVVGAAAVISTSTTAGAAVAGVEDEGADCAVNVPSSTTSNAKLPDPFKRIDGTRISTRSDWRCRREEIKKLAERFVYGTKPAKPASVTGTVSSTNITVNVSDQGRSASFSASVSLPGGTGPFPAVFVVGGLGADTATIRAAGVAVINYDPLAVGKEGTGRTNKQGAFYSIYGATSGTGILAAWAWGVSRIIDVIEQSGGSIIKADGLGVTGCSRYGKGAFAIGAFDQRIALTMPIESGSGGVPAMRSIATESGAQPLSSAYSEQPWLGDAFSSFTGNPNALPIDQHSLVAMAAPRGLLIMENPSIAWLGAKSGSVSALAGAEVYKALGVGDAITYWSAVSDGNHCAVRSEWRDPLQKFLKRFLLKTGNDAGVFRIASNAQGSLSQWVDWTTPTLSGSTSGPATSNPPTSSAPTSSVPTSSVPTSSLPTSSVPTSSGPTGSTGACSATYRTVNSWQGGFQGEVTVKAGSAAINGWTVRWTLASGQTIAQLWSGTLTTSGSAVTVKNATWNGSLGASATTTFGFIGNGTASTPTLTCTSP